MRANVVIFGLAHSGKSTLVGYLFVATNKDFDFENYIEEIKKKYPNNYDSSEDYAYVVDTYADEIIKSKEEKLGHTKGTHLKGLQLEPDLELTVIDTPGVEHRERERNKGMYYGDIGVFCIEMNELLEDDFFINNKYRHIINTLLLWSKFNKKLIVVLTKADLCGFSHQNYNLAIDKINFVCDKAKIKPKIIPISIIVKERVGHNIISKSNNLDWYNGQVFIELLKNELIRKPTKKNSDLLFMFDRQFDRKGIQSYPGKSWTIKIISGELNVGDRVTISSMIHENKNEIINIHATIKTIRYDIISNEETSVFKATAGNIVGIDISDIKHGLKKLSKSEIDITKTSCGFSSKNKFLYSRLLELEISAKSIERFEVNHQLGMVWFGRMIAIKIISCRFASSKTVINVTLCSDKMNIALPMTNEGHFIFTNVIVADKINNKYEFYDAKLTKIIKE